MVVVYEVADMEISIVQHGVSMCPRFYGSMIDEFIFGVMLIVKCHDLVEGINRSYFS